jgi:hypothetical protein
VVEEFDYIHLGLDEDENSQMFIPTRFALKLKDDFLKFYLRNEYERAGFPQNSI